MKKRIPLILLAVLLSMLIVFCLGPKPDKPSIAYTIPDLPIELSALEKFVDEKEAAVENVRPSEKAQIIWANDSITQTEWSIVFLHGFSATHEEANPLHFNLAKRYGANLYLARLAEHGIKSEDALLNMTADDLLKTAIEAVAIGKKLGKKTLIISSSTGGTVSIAVAANLPEIADALVMYSPNIEIYDPKSKLLTIPWGLQIARWIFEGKHRSYPASEYMKEHWTTRYRLEAIVQLRLLLNYTMTAENFQQIDQPYLIGYYYKNDSLQDRVVSVEAIHDFNQKTSTDNANKQLTAFPEAEGHVICNPKLTPAYERVYDTTVEWLETTLNMQAVTDSAVLSELL